MFVVQDFGRQRPVSIDTAPALKKVLPFSLPSRLLMSVPQELELVDALGDMVHSYDLD